MAKVSIIIPVYNTEKHLKECLNSVINQTLKDIEIICVNDGSTDNSSKILEEYAQKDERIKVINQENKGLSGARNTGLRYITSEYCYFLDSDDYIEPNLLKTACSIFNNNDADYICFGSELFVEGDNIIQEIPPMQEYLRIKFKGNRKVNFDIGQNQNIHVWNKIFKTSIIKKNNIRFIEGLLYEDIFFTWYYFFLSNRIYFEPRIFHHYRVHSNSIMEKATSNKSYESAIPHMLNWHELFIEISKNKKLFSKNYRNLLILLNDYKRRTIQMAKPEDKYRIKELTKTYKKELDEVFIKECGIIKFLICSQNIFWFRKGVRKSTLCFFGVRLKVNLEKLRGAKK